MKIYAINLLREPNKREHILNECTKHNLEVEMIDAVDGKSLSDEFIQNGVYDYPNCYLTLGEIGCALSHIKIYEKMMSENIPIALVLEDDSIFSENISSFLSAVEKHDKSSIANVYLLTADTECIINNQINFDNFILYKIRFATRTNGYILNLKSAKSLLNFLYPIRYEADMWSYFSIAKSINIYAAVPYLISSNDLAQNQSSIETDRKNIMLEREIYRRNYFKYKEKKPKLRQLFWRIFFRKKEKTHWNRY